jgi:hypothetical protein
MFDKLDVDQSGTINKDDIKAPQAIRNYQPPAASMPAAL